MLWSVFAFIVVSMDSWNHHTNNILVSQDVAGGGVAGGGCRGT